MPQLIEHLRLRDAVSTSAVCIFWRDTWREVLTQRRIPAYATSVYRLEMSASSACALLPGRLCVAHPLGSPQLSFYAVENGAVAGRLHVCDIPEIAWPFAMAATDEALFVADVNGEGVMKLRLDGCAAPVKDKLARLNLAMPLQRPQIYSMALVGDSLHLLAVQGVLHTFDQRSLAERGSVHLPVLHDERCECMEAHDGLLYIACSTHDWIRVVTPSSGKEVRRIRGAFERPFSLAIFEERIYLLAAEQLAQKSGRVPGRVPADESEDDERSCALLLHVLSLDGTVVHRPFRFDVTTDAEDIDQFKVTVTRHGIFVSDWNGRTIRPIVFS